MPKVGEEVPGAQGENRMCNLVCNSFKYTAELPYSSFSSAAGGSAVGSGRASVGGAFASGDRERDRERLASREADRELSLS